MTVRSAGSARVQWGEGAVVDTDSTSCGLRTGSTILRPPFGYRSARLGDIDIPVKNPVGTRQIERPS